MNISLSQDEVFQTLIQAGVDKAKMAGIDTRNMVAYVTVNANGQSVSAEIEFRPKGEKR